MKWKFREWQEFADCSITFNGDSTHEIIVKFKNVPDYDKFGAYIHVDNIQNGWR